MSKKNHSGLWVMIVSGLLLETISCVQYFASRHAIRQEAETRAQTELRKAELEIEKHTVEMETAAKTLAMLAEKHVDKPDSIYAATRSVVRAIGNTSSIAVAYVPGYFPKEGRYFEVCSSRISGEGLVVNGEDSIYTRQIGSSAHDYTAMEWWQNGFVHDSCWWCEPYLDDSGSQTYVVSCSYPVHDRNGAVVAVVCVDLSLDYLQKVSEYLQVYQNSYYSIRSSKGLDIVPVPDTIAGRKYNIYHEEIDATGWHIEIIIPEEELFADLNRIGLLVGILMLIGLLVLALILIYSARTTQKMIRFAEKNQRMEGELEVAKTIQMAMLPTVFPPFADRLDVNVYGIVVPAKEVGGDLYDFYIRQEKLYFCIGDVSGKGVPAALLMVMTRSLFRNTTVHEDDLGEAMKLMNKSLCEQNTQNMFLTLFLGVLDCKTGRLNYCNAGHNAPIHLRFDDLRFTIEKLPVMPNLPLGVEPEMTFVSQSTQLQYGDTLFLYTDGLNEAENSAHTLYGEERMMSEMEDMSPLSLVQKMQASVEAYRGSAEQSDDLTMLAIRYQYPALIMRNDIEQIPTLAEWMEGLEIPAELSMSMQLALEEIVSNVMLYAYPGRSGMVIVECNRAKSQESRVKSLIFTVTDSGIPFDPTQQKEADITLSAEERPIGGLGIYLVRQIMDEVRYERIEDKNVLTLVKNL